ncbi:MAG: hypothetical protein VKN72_10870 [Nostocales cyanobacterium 94392]|nr:hypothetical protein [Nostocales cyanobacterium 94392]
MNEENQELKKPKIDEQVPDDSRSPGVDRIKVSPSPETDRSPGVDRGLGSSENTPEKKNTEESLKDS